MVKTKILFCLTCSFLFAIIFSFSAFASDSVLISEVNYNPLNPSDKYIEITVRDDFGADIDTTGWYITTFDGEQNISFPAVLDFGEVDYLSVRTCSGVDDIDATDGSATIYLNLGSNILDDSSDEIALYDASSNLIDFVRYNGGNSGILLQNWQSADLGPTALTGESVQIHGEDIDSSENWVSAPTSESNPNLIKEIVTHSTDIINFIIENGANRDTIIPEDEKSTAPNFTISRSAAVSLAEEKIIHEMLNFSYNFYRARGLNNPKLNPSGAINITLTKNNKFDAAANPRGSIAIDLGGNLSTIEIASFIKWGVEHEFYHLLQYERTHLNGTSAPNAPFERMIRRHSGPYAFLSEGLCEYWGLQISKTQYNRTDEQLFMASVNVSKTYSANFSSIPYNYTDILKNSDFDLTALTTGGSVNVYTYGYLYMKYIADTYGEQKLLHFHNITRMNSSRTGVNDFVADAVVEKAFKDEGINKTFADIHSDWREWIYTTYGNNITYTSIKTFNGTKLNEQGTLVRWGTDYELFNINTAIPFNITIGGTAVGNYSISSIIEYKNGSRAIIRNRFTGKGAGNISINNLIKNNGNISRIVLVKTRIDDRPLLFTYNVTFIRFNSAPNITNSTPANRSVIVPVNKSIIFNVSAKDAENDTLFYNWTINKTQVAFSTPNFTFIPNRTGNFTLRVFVTDGFGGSANTSWNISVINRAPNITSFTPVNKTPILIKNSTTIFRVNATDPDNHTLTYNWTLNGTQVAFSTPNFTFIPNRTGNFTIRVVVSDGFGGNTSTSWRANVVANTSFNLRKGWNLFSPIINPFFSGNKSLQLFGKGYNLFGYSADAPFTWRNAIFNNGTAVKNTSEAISSGWVKNASYWDSVFQAYKQVSLTTGVNELNSGLGYRIYANQNVTMTIPNTDGSLTTAKFTWTNAKIMKGNQIKTISAAQTAGWVQLKINTLNTTTQKYDFIPGAGGTKVQAYKGYWIYAFHDNLTLIGP